MCSKSVKSLPPPPLFLRRLTPDPLLSPPPLRCIERGLRSGGFEGKEGVAVAGRRWVVEEEKEEQDTRQDKNKDNNGKLQNEKQTTLRKVMETKIAKFTGSTEMEQSLDRMVQATNDGFSGGKVTKQDLVSWIVMYFEKYSFQDCLEKIRQDHFDQVVYLESVLRQAKLARKNGADMPDLGSLLSPIATAPAQGRPKRAKAAPVATQQAIFDSKPS